MVTVSVQRRRRWRLQANALLSEVESIGWERRGFKQEAVSPCCTASVALSTPNTCADQPGSGQVIDEMKKRFYQTLHDQHDCDTAHI